MQDTFANLSRGFSSHPLTRHAPWEAWTRFFVWQIRSRLQHEVIFPWIEGQRLAIRRGMTGATGNIYMGLHEFCDMMLMLHLLNEGDLFLDVGSNVGSYMVLASGVRKARTWAFEPDPETVRYLKRNIEINGIEDRVIVHELALGDTDGEISFTRGLDTMNRVATKEDGNVRKVCVRTLDSLITTNRPIMMKIDAEGFEERVLRGAETVLSHESLRVIELETVTPEIERTLGRHGFMRSYYAPFQRSLTTSPASNLAPSNSLFVRDWHYVAGRLVTARPVNVLGKLI